MDNEEVLAAILVAASAFLLLLSVITLCIIVSCSGRNNKKQKSLEIPVSNLRHHSTNMAFENDQDHKTKEETQIDSHKADWPTNYSRYAVSRSYAFPQRAETSNPSSSSTNHQHKTFSEEVFSSVNAKSHGSTGGNHNHTKQAHGSNTATNHMNGHDGSNGIWKHRAESITESAGHQSLDRQSINTTSTASHTRDYSHSPDHKPSYYSTFKTHVSPAGHHQTNHTSSQSTTSQQEKINSTHNGHHQREKLNNNAGSSSDDVKVFKFNIS